MTSPRSTPNSTTQDIALALRASLELEHKAPQFEEDTSESETEEIDSLLPKPRQESMTEEIKPQSLQIQPSTLGALICGSAAGLFGVGVGVTSLGPIGLTGGLLCIPGIACGHYFFELCDEDPPEKRREEKNCLGFSPKHP